MNEFFLFLIKYFEFWIKKLIIFNLRILLIFTFWLYISYFIFKDQLYLKILLIGLVTFDIEYKPKAKVELFRRELKMPKKL